MTSTITLTFTIDTETAPTPWSLTGILLDALAEFVNHRGPTPETYVNTRYPDTPDYAWLNRPKKIAQVKARCDVAQALHQGIWGSVPTITEHAPTFCIQSRDLEEGSFARWRDLRTGFPSRQAAHLSLIRIREEEAQGYVESLCEFRITEVGSDAYYAQPTDALEY